MNFPTQSLGFILADNGFDVWLGNVRGNSYSLNHTKYNKTQDIFWDFSWDQMAAYDLPAMVDYILEQTGESKMFYIGHSQGTLISFAGLSQNLDLSSKIKLFVALGPVSTVGHVVSPVKYISDIGIPTVQQVFVYYFR
jgi:pimeloyl-ACP methyl ester carboxylesterase